MILEGELKIRLDDGREFSALVFGVEHAKRVLDALANGECPERPQRASGAYIQCGKEAGHEGGCK